MVLESKVLEEIIAEHCVRQTDYDGVTVGWSLPHGAGSGSGFITNSIEAD